MTSPLRRALVALAIALTVAACLPAARGHGGFYSRVTWYRLTGITASGEWTHDGGAACPRAYLGARVYLPEPGITLVCNDTGAVYWFEQGEFKLDVWSPYRPAWMSGDWYDVEVWW